MNTRGMHDPAIAIRTVSAGVSQLRLRIMKRLWKIVNACRKGETRRPEASFIDNSGASFFRSNAGVAGRESGDAFSKPAESMSN